MKCFQPGSKYRDYVSCCFPWCLMRICAGFAPATKSFIMQTVCRRWLFYYVAPFKMSHLGFSWITTLAWIRAKGQKPYRGFYKWGPSRGEWGYRLRFGPEDWTLPSILRNVSSDCLLLWHEIILSFFVQLSLDLTDQAVSKIWGLKMSHMLTKNSALSLPKNHKHMPHSMTPPPTPLFSARLTICKFFQKNVNTLESGCGSRTAVVDLSPFVYRSGIRMCHYETRLCSFHRFLSSTYSIK